MRIRESKSRIFWETSRALAKALEHYFKRELLIKEIEVAELAIKITNTELEKAKTTVK